MNIVFDNDATVTDFNCFVEKYAIPYFKKKYNLRVVYPEKLEIEDIFDIRNCLVERGLSINEAEAETSNMLKHFWISYRFIIYSCFSKFRKGAARTINMLRKQGHNIEIHTSRNMTGEQTIVGFWARVLTIAQYWINGVWISKNKFFFYRTDLEKIEGIQKNRADLLFEDKPFIINKLCNENLKIICVAGKHNVSIKDSKNVFVLKEYSVQAIESALLKLIGEREIEYNKKIVKADKLYRKLILLCPMVMKYFKPIILHEDRIHRNGAIIYAPNHRSTLDPIVITAIIKEHIHWVALKRFFLAEDSIFNNNKNKYLCRITAWLFHELSFFPVERKKDNSDANNIVAIKDMYRFLQKNRIIGIFPEGTTRREKGKEFGVFDDGFLFLAQGTKACIQPITIYWFEDKFGHRRVVVNFGNVFTVNKAEIEQKREEYLLQQKKMLQENINKANELMLLK